MTDTPWLNVQTAADYALCGEDTIGDALRDGSLRGHQKGRGGRWRIHRDDLDAWIRGETAPARPIPSVTRGRSA